MVMQLFAECYIIVSVDRRLRMMVVLGNSHCRLLQQKVDVSQVCWWLLRLNETHFNYQLLSHTFAGASDRVTTNLEYSGNSLNLEKSWNSQEILCNLREKLYRIK